jgi:pimeloyl-ACP methyl ester carboxylesterase
MAKKTCAACDCKLDANPIKVKIGGKTVEVCCDECAQKLNEADFSAHTACRSGLWSVKRAAANILHELARVAWVAAVLLIGALIMLFYLNPMKLKSVQASAGTPASTYEISESTKEGNKLSPIKHSIQTPSGRISYMEQGTGPVALFVHGVLLNGYLWRHQLADLSDIRRNIAVDLLAHGDTEIAPDQDVSVTANAKMLKEFLDALHIDRVDLVGNDSGGGIAQIFAATYPERVRSLTLTDCDTHDNWPPEAFKPFLAMAANGGLRGTLEAMLADKNVYRSPQALGPAYEHPERLSDESIETYLRPLVRAEQRTRDLQRFLAAFDNKHTLAVESRLKTLKAPTLIVWGTDDVYFDVKWSHWLADTIPGTRRRVEFKGARIFFPEERWTDFDKELRAHWQAALKEAR